MGGGRGPTYAHGLGHVVAMVVLVVRIAARLAGKGRPPSAGSSQCCPAEGLHRGRLRGCWRLAELTMMSLELGGMRLGPLGLGVLAWCFVTTVSPDLIRSFL